MEENKQINEPEKVKCNPEDYVDENGNYDLVTPRSYTAKELSKLKKVLSLAVNKRVLIQHFDFSEGNLKIEMQSGKIIEAPLSDLEFIIKENPNGPSSFEIRHNQEKIGFAFNYMSFDACEIQDMFNILVRAGNVREPKSYKALKIFSEILGWVQAIVSDYSLKDFAKDSLIDNSLTEIVGNCAYKPSKNKEQKDNSKKSKLRWVWISFGIIAALFIALVVLAIIFGDDEDEITIEGYTPERDVYYLYGGNNDIQMLIPVKVTQNFHIESDSTMAFVATPPPLWLNDSYIKLYVEEKGPKKIQFRGISPSGDWEIKDLMLTAQTEKDEDRDIIVVKGDLISENHGEVEVSYYLIQPNDPDASYYIGNIGDYPALFEISIQPGLNEQVLEGNLYFNDKVFPLKGELIHIEEYDEWGEAYGEIYYVDSVDFTMELTFDYNGYWFITGTAEFNGIEDHVRAESINNHLWEVGM